MDVHKIIAQLRQERACLDEAVMCLERLVSKRSPRRGRPPSWLKAINGTTQRKQHSADGSTRRGKRVKAVSAPSQTSAGA